MVPDPVLEGAAISGNRVSRNLAFLCASTCVHESGRGALGRRRAFGRCMGRPGFLPEMIHLRVVLPTLPFVTSAEPEDGSGACGGVARRLIPEVGLSLLGGPWGLLHNKAFV